MTNCSAERHGIASGQKMKACVFVYACDIMLVVEARAAHHLSVHPCEQRPAVPLVYLSTHKFSTKVQKCVCVYIKKNVAKKSESEFSTLDKILSLC